MIRTKKLYLNTVFSLLLQLTTVICGFVLPKMILKQFGSEVNGLVTSITQFLAVISFLELGIGAVVQSTLYGPLAENDNLQVSRIIASAGKFFRRLALIMLVYISVLVVIYPFISESDFGWKYIASLIVVMGISSFAQYYFGVVDRLLLNADQRGYIQYTTQIITLLANTIACVIFISLGASIHIVKLTTSLIYLLRPFIIRLYVNKHYQIDRKVVYIGEPIKQKWNGVAQHVSAVILDSTGSIILTVFATLSDVSIYSVYHLVVYGVKQLFMSTTNGIQALLGELWAKKDIKELHNVFSWTEWIIHMGTVFIFGCTSVLIVPFVKVYTSGITDAVYEQPLFALLLVIANAGHCLRLPYNIMILASGHYKQTQSNYIIAATMNMLVSIVTVKYFGLVGLTFGTLLAMGYQTIWMAVYNSKHLVKRPIQEFVKQIFVDVVSFILIIVACSWISIKGNSYLGWAMMALKVVVLSWMLIVLINGLFYKEKVKELWKRFFLG